MTTQIKDPKLMDYLMNDELKKMSDELFVDELVEEMSDDDNNALKLIIDGSETPVDAFKKLLENPEMMTNMLSIIKQKIKSKNINESELMEDLENAKAWVKNLPEAEDIQELFSQLGIDGFET